MHQEQSMQKSPHLTFRRGDWFAIALVLLIAAATLVAFLPKGSADERSVVQIRQDGSLIQELPINIDQEFIISGSYENIVCISGGRVSITQSDCPGTDCVHSGWISTPGRSIVCLPNRVEVRIVGTASDVDFVVR